MDATILPNVMTAADVGRWLSLPASVVKKLARNGKIPSRRLPSGELVFDRADLAEWFKRLPGGKGIAHAS